MVGLQTNYRLPREYIRMCGEIVGPLLTTTYLVLQHVLNLGVDLGMVFSVLLAFTFWHIKTCISLSSMMTVLLVTR